MRKAIFKGIKNNGGFLKGDILDFGCGEKPYQDLFIYKSYTGVDFKDSGHDNSQNKVDYFWDGKKLPFQSESFDSILATEVFEHIFNIDEVLQELRRVLKPNGHIVATIPFIIHEHEVPYDFARYTHYGIESIFKNNSFQVIENQQYGSYGESIIQLIIWFLGKLSSTRFRYLTIFLRVLIVLPIMIFLNIFSIIFPKMQSGMYLSNTIVGKNN